MSTLSGGAVGRAGGCCAEGLEPSSRKTIHIRVHRVIRRPFNQGSSEIRQPVREYDKPHDRRISMRLFYGVVGALIVASVLSAQTPIPAPADVKAAPKDAKKSKSGLAYK